MRLFIAINFSPEMRGHLLSLQSELRRHAVRGRFTPPENLHLTLAFLGECSEKEAQTAAGVMDGLAFGSFPVSVGRVGRFRRDKGDLWWAGLDESRALLHLQEELSLKLKNAGFTLEDRKFKPHITLARDVVTDGPPWTLQPFEEDVCAIDLMRSEQIAGRLTYTSIHQTRGACGEPA